MNRVSMIEQIKMIPGIIKKTYNIKDNYYEKLYELFSSRKIKKVIFVGSGTSYFVCLICRNLFQHYLGVEGRVFYPTVFSYHEEANPNNVYNKDEILVIGFSQTGTSISTIDACKKAKHEGYTTIGVSENESCALGEYTDQIIQVRIDRIERDPMRVDPETRWFTISVFAFYLGVIETAKKMGTISEEEYRVSICDAEKVAESMNVVLEESLRWYYRNKNNFTGMQKSMVVGYGTNLPTALEGRLKFSEAYGIQSMAYEQEELIHIPMRDSESDNYIFMLVTKGEEFNRAVEIYTHYKEYLTKNMFVISTESIDNSEKNLTISTKVNEQLMPVVMITPLQVLTALISADAGIDSSVEVTKLNELSGHL